MQTILIGDRLIELEFTAAAFEMVMNDAELEGIENFKEQMKGDGWMRRLARYITMLGNAHLMKENKKPDITEEWVLNHVYPKEMFAMTAVVSLAMFEGMVMESADDSDEEVDVVKEEIEKKEDAGIS